VSIDASFELPTACRCRATVAATVIARATEQAAMQRKVPGSAPGSFNPRL
jgi:hypothetical protein